MAACAVVCTSLSGCAALKIEPAEPVPETVIAAPGTEQAELSVVRLNEYPEGNHCFEPLLYVLTIGIIPTHCVQRYHVIAGSETPESNEGLATHFVVTSMQGWVTLLLLPTRKWQFGFAEDPAPEIEKMIETVRGE